jgi:Diacylglycerol kinase accessory domain
MPWDRLCRLYRQSENYYLVPTLSYDINRGKKFLPKGMDAQVAYGFHHLRNEKPYLAQGPVANKVHHFLLYRRA